MKKTALILLVLCSLIFSSCTVDNGKTDEDIKVCFVANECSKTILFNKRHIITNQDLLKLNLKTIITINNLFYDDSCKTPYKNEQLIKDITLYVFNENALIKDDLIWNNENAVYASVESQYVNAVLVDVEKAFESLSFNAVFIVKMDISINPHLLLLFILNDNKQQEFIDLLSLDGRINSSYKCRDLPFDSTDNRYLDIITNNIKVGETLEIIEKGEYNHYCQQFYHEGILIELSNYDANKVYLIDDFPFVDIASVGKSIRGRLYLELKKPGYYNVIKTLDILARLSIIKSVEPVYFDVVQPVWEISDRAIIDFVDEKQKYNLGMTKVVGLRPGEVTIYYSGLNYIITVTD